jgi:hypothetical protein
VGKHVPGFGGKARRKDATWKTKVNMGGWGGGEVNLRGLAGGMWIGFTWLRIATPVLNAVMNLLFLVLQNYLFNYIILD